MPRVVLSKRDKNDLQEEVKIIKGYVWCRINDILEDLCHGDRDKKVVILACLEALEDFSD